MSVSLRSAFSRPARLLAAVLVVCAMGTVPAAAAVARPERSASIVVDARTGEVLHQENADAVRHPASLTKMMTLYMVFEALDAGQLSLDGMLPVSDHAQSMPATKLGVRAGSTLRTESAILGLVTKSANDAAVVLAEALGGSESRFAEMMTRKARQLGMRGTVYRNASGLPDADQVTTARDLSILSRALIEDHPKYYPYFSRRNFVYGGRTLANHNRLMSRYDGMDGIKTGFINASGFNLAASAVRGGRRLVAVVMGGKSALSRDNRMAALLDQSFGLGSGADAMVVARGEAIDIPATPVTVTAASRSTAARSNAAAIAPQADRKPQTITQLAAASIRAPQAKPAGKDEGDWGVQIGAFSSKASGKKALDAAAKSLPRGLPKVRADLTEVPTRKGTVYRARFTGGLDERQARELCDALKKKSGQRCMPVAPDA